MPHGHTPLFGSAALHVRRHNNATYRPPTTYRMSCMSDEADPKTRLVIVLWTAAAQVIGSTKGLQLQRKARERLDVATGAQRNDQAQGSSSSTKRMIAFHIRKKAWSR